MNNLLSKSIMKTAVCIFIICISAMLSAQKKANPKFAVCNDVIGTVKMFNHYKDQVEKTTIFKTKASLPAHLKKFEFLANGGLTEIQLKKNAGTPDIISLEMINEQYSLPKNTPVSIDGYSFDDSQINIYSEIITDGKIMDSNGQKILYLTTAGN